MWAIFRILLHEVIFFLSVFSSSEVLGKITSIRSKLPTAACWSREEKRGNYEANLLYVESVFSTTDTRDKSFTVVFARWGVKFDGQVKISVRRDNYIIQLLSYMCRQGERKACNHIVLWILISLL